MKKYQHSRWGRLVSRWLFATWLIYCPCIRAAILENIAPFGTAWQTTDHSSGLYPAELANDDLLETFNHTDSTSADSAWELSYEEEHEVVRIELIPRIQCCDGRLNGSTLKLFDLQDQQAFEINVIDNGPGEIFAVDFPDGLWMSRLRVGFAEGEAGIVHLAEVRVFIDIGIPPKIIDFSAVEQVDGSFILNWQTADAESVVLSGIGEVALTGQHPIHPTESTAWLLTASNASESIIGHLATIVNGQPVFPRINEIVADAGGDPDWVEIWNPANGATNLVGYVLSDGPNKYTFPDTPLASGAFLVVEPPFGLAKEPDSIMLSAPDGQRISSYHYPQQYAGGSYGYDMHHILRYLLVPTPGAHNTRKITLGYLNGVTFSHQRGFREAPFQLILQPQTTDALVYYTTNGSNPSPTSTATSVFSEAIPIARTTVLRAAEFKDGFVSSPIIAHTYIFRSDVETQPILPSGFPTNWQPDGISGLTAPIPAPSDYEMAPEIVSVGTHRDMNGNNFNMESSLSSLPVLSISMPLKDLWGFDTGIHANALKRGIDWERVISLEMIHPRSGISTHDLCGLRIHGGRARVPEVLKKSFRTYFRGEYGSTKFTHPIMEHMPEVGLDHFILRGGTGQTWMAPYRDRDALEAVTYLRDEFYRDSFREMGHPSISGSFVHLYINGLYWGLYNPVERPGADYAANHFGGSDADYDVIQWANVIPAVAADGTIDAWTELMELSRQTPIDDAELAEIEQRVDIDNLIDYLLLNFYLGASDWVGNNTYAFASRPGSGVSDQKFRFLPWDGEQIFGNIYRDSTTDGRDSYTHPLGLHDNLRSNIEYRRRFADRLHKHLVDEDGKLAPEQAAERFRDMAAHIDWAIVAESARWGDLVDPSLPSLNREDHWLPEVNEILSQYIALRPDLTLGHMRKDSLYPYTKAPVVGLKYGTDSIYRLVITMPYPQTGEIYYTMDGSDPRLAGDLVSTNALIFEGSSPPLPGDVVIKARVRAFGGEWSALEEERFTLSNPSDSLVVSELMYHPAAPSAAEITAGFDDDDFFEYLELRNIGPLSVHLGHMRFTDGIDAVLPTNSFLSPGACALLVANRQAFEMRFGETPVLAEWSHETRLNNGGENIELVDSSGHPLLAFTYDDDASRHWPTEADGEGPSLELIAPYSRPDHSLGRNWRAGASPGYSSGQLFNGEDLSSYAFGTNSVQIYQPTPDIAPVFSYRFNMMADDLLFSIESSVDLNTWLPAATQPYLFERLPDGRALLESYLLQNETDSRFMRVRAELKR